MTWKLGSRPIMSPRVFTTSFYRSMWLWRFVFGKIEDFDGLQQRLSKEQKSGWVVQRPFPLAKKNGFKMFQDWKKVKLHFWVQERDHALREAQDAQSSTFHFFSRKGVLSALLSPSLDHARRSNIASCCFSQSQRLAVTKHARDTKTMRQKRLHYGHNQLCPVFFGITRVIS